MLCELQAVTCMLLSHPSVRKMRLRLYYMTLTKMHTYKGFRPRTDPIGFVKAVASGFKQDPPDFCCSGMYDCMISTKPWRVLKSVRYISLPDSRYRAPEGLR